MQSQLQAQTEQLLQQEINRLKDSHSQLVVEYTRVCDDIDSSIAEAAESSDSSAPISNEDDDDNNKLPAWMEDPSMEGTLIDQSKPPALSNPSPKPVSAPNSTSEAPQPSSSDKWTDKNGNTYECVQGRVVVQPSPKKETTSDEPPQRSSKPLNINAPIFTPSSSRRRSDTDPSLPNLPQPGACRTLEQVYNTAIAAYRKSRTGPVKLPAPCQEMEEAWQRGCVAEAILARC